VNNLNKEKKEILLTVWRFISIIIPFMKIICESKLKNNVFKQDLRAFFTLFEEREKIIIFTTA